MRKILTIAFIFVAIQSFAQNIRIDEKERTKSNVDRLNQKAATFQNRDSVFYYYLKASEIAQSILYYEGELTSCRGLVQYHKNDKVIDERLKYTYRIVQIQEKRGTTTDQAKAYQEFGKLYFNEKIYEKAAENFRKGFELQGIKLDDKYEAGIWLTRSLRISNDNDAALQTSRKLQFDEKSLSIFQRISLYKEKAEIYHNLRAYQKELDAYQSIISIAKGTRYSSFVPTAWNNIGFVHKFLEHENEAKGAFTNTLRTASSNETELRATANYNLGLILHNQGSSDSAMVCFKAAYKLYEKQDNWEALANSKNMMALSYFHNDDLYNAQNELNGAFDIERRHDLKKQEAKSHEIQSMFYEDVFDYENSLTSYKRYLSIRDSLLTIDRTEESRLLYDQYKAEQLEKQLRVVWADMELEIVSLAEERARIAEESARLIAEQERANAQMERDAAELRRLQLLDEQRKLKAKQQELELIQRDKELADLALEKEQLAASENEKKIALLAKQNELEVERRKNEKQRRTNERQRYQNNLQLILGILFFIILLLLVFLIAYRQLRRRKKRIEEQSVIIAESAREIELQKEKSDGLLLNILPHAVAEELKSRGAAKPRSYDEVSVGFTDFSGFTMISEQLSPEDLVAQLDTMFLEFDKIIEKYNLQRIKTIGDAYMFAAGLPEPMEDHADKSIRASLEIRDYIDSFNKSITPGLPQWNIRIGVHSGPVVAGVIGIKKFAYDIWGDTVNTAARMESSGQIGKVNISGITKSQINGAFITEHRGRVEAKNKGAIDMYFVEMKN